MRRGAQGSGPGRPGAPANSGERVAGGVSLPTPPGAGHFLYHRWADAGIAPALRTIVSNPHGERRAGSVHEGGRRDPPFLLQPPTPVLRGPARTRDVAAGAAAPPWAHTAATAPGRQEEWRSESKSQRWPRGRLPRLKNTSWSQPRRSLCLHRRRYAGPLPPGPPCAEAASFSSSPFPLLPPGGRRRQAHSHTHPVEPRPRGGCEVAGALTAPRLLGVPGASYGRQRPGRPDGARRGGARLAGGVGSATRSLLRPRPRPAR